MSAPSPDRERPRGSRGGATRDDEATRVKVFGFALLTFGLGCVLIFSYWIAAFFSDHWCLYGRKVDGRGGTASDVAIASGVLLWGVAVVAAATRKRRLEHMTVEFGISFAVVLIAIFLLAPAVFGPSRCVYDEAAPATAGAFRCYDVPPDLLVSIADRLTVKGGSLRNANAVNSDGLAGVLLAAEIDGTGMEGRGDTGVWALTGDYVDLELYAVEEIWALNAYARKFSTWGADIAEGSEKARQRDAYRKTDAYDRAVNCTRNS